MRVVRAGRWARPRSRPLILAVAAACLAVTAAAGACARHTLRPGDPAAGLTFPRDHAAHDDAQTEWWHFHGHVADAAGRRYDFFLGFVTQHTDRDRLAGLPVHPFVDPFEVAYLTVTDRTAARFHVREKHAFPDVWAAGADARTLRLRHDSWRAAAAPDGTIDLAASTRRAGLALRLRPDKPLAPRGGRGWLEVPPRSSHRYYSVPRLSAEGTFVIGGEPRAVRGIAWLKHEWGFLYDETIAGWVWLGVQLSSGADVEIGLVFDLDWRMRAGSFAALSEADGRTTELLLETVGVSESGETWRSPRTGTVYPVGWVVDVPGRGRLVLRAVLDAQEMVVFPVNLWAGALTVAGTFDGETIGGDAFVEVAGLDRPLGRALLRSGGPR